MCRKYKPNNTYILEIHGCQYYIGCHTLKCKDEMTETDILSVSSNPIGVAARKGLITYEEYKECCRIVYIEEFDSKEEAQNREVELIEKFRNHYGDRCLNQSKGNKYGGHSGLKHSNETKKKISDSKGGFGVRQYDLNGNFIAEYPSIHEAERQTGVYHGSICSCLKGRRKSAGKSIWKYA